MNNKEATAGWSRPADWLPIPEFDESKDQVYILMAIANSNINPIAFSMTGDTTVHWGDVENTTESKRAYTTAQKNYSWNDASASSQTSDGLRQVLIKIEADRGEITRLDFSIRPDVMGSKRLYSSVLEINGNVDSYSSLRVQSTYAYHSAMQQFSLAGTSSVTDMVALFDDCHSLKSVPKLDTSRVTYMAFMFSNCYTLISIPELDTSSATDMTGIFRNCYTLKSAPELDMSGVTNMALSFDDCFSLSNLNFVQDTLSRDFDLRNTNLSATKLNAIFHQLADLTGQKAQTLRVTGALGADGCDRSIAEAKNWIVT